MKYLKCCEKKNIYTNLKLSTLWNCLPKVKIFPLREFVANRPALPETLRKNFNRRESIWVRNVDLHKKGRISKTKEIELKR